MTKAGITLKAPKVPKTPEAPVSWGGCLRKRRLELGLTISETARRLKTTLNTLKGWENDKGKIRPLHMPKIIHFLGYIPSLLPMETLGQKITAYRYIHGLSKQRFAGLLHVDLGTLRKWEHGEGEPKGEKKKRVEELLNTVRI